MQLACFVAVGCKFLCAFTIKTAFARLQFIKRRNLAGQDVFGKICDGRHIFSKIIQDARGRFAERVLHILP